MSLGPLETARSCRHYAMCKIDYLGRGLCPGAAGRYYVSFYPQGRMDLYAAAASGRLPLTPVLAEVARSCTLCGECDMQCHFVQGLRPSAAASALRELVERLTGTREPEEVPSDPFLDGLREIVGDEWASNDPAHLEAYSDDPCPISRRTVPRYVALPATAAETASIVRHCMNKGIDYAVRGNGSSVMGFVLTPGLVIDTARMRWMEFDEEDWCVRVGAGVSSHDLQRAALARGFLVNAAEPAALYCANMVCSGIFSLFSSSLGTCRDNVLDAEFVSPEGEVFRLCAEGGPDLSFFRMEERGAPGICTEATVRLHPLSGDESGILVPFGDFESALEYARELNASGTGLGIGMLGTEYLSSFIAPVAAQAEALRKILPGKLGIEYSVVVLGDGGTLESASRAADAVLSQEVMRCLILGLPSLSDDGISDILAGLEGDEPPYTLLARPEMLPVLEAVLGPSPEKLASAVDEDLRELYREVYRDPSMTDIFMMNAVRSVSSRMGREGHVVAFIVYVPMDDAEAVRDLDLAFADVAASAGVRGEFGFITPLDRGRRGVMEWDMYLDHTDPEQVRRMQGAMAEAAGMLEELQSKDPRFLWIRYLFNQGFCRKETFLYRRAIGE
ncbi:MAG: hypothetical protein AVO35_06865 [Candidatus Aegiribacteria sp. MLS_C]|nr:MAG: hypothetical protein AVO35_06865 [Candidatus Aegiribacteria sp. MLS_C]